jgi:hypothetical protein
VTRARATEIGATCPCPSSCLSDPILAPAPLFSPVSAAPRFRPPAGGMWIRPIGLSSSNATAMSTSAREPENFLSGGPRRRRACDSRANIKIAQPNPQRHPRSPGGATALIGSIHCSPTRTRGPRNRCQASLNLRYRIATRKTDATSGAAPLQPACGNSGRATKFARQREASAASSYPPAATGCAPGQTFRRRPAETNRAARRGL